MIFTNVVDQAQAPGTRYLAGLQSIPVFVAWNITVPGTLVPGVHFNFAQVILPVRRLLNILG